MIRFEKYKKNIPGIFSYFVLFVTLTWQIVTSFFGIDLMDSGYYIANYKHFFDENVSSDIGTFLSNFFGGLIYKLIPSHHYLIFQLLGVLVLDISILCFFRLLSDKMPKLLLSCCLLVGSLTFSMYPYSLNYNTFSVLFWTLSIVFLIYGLGKNKRIDIFVSGLFMGLGVLFRLPNILGFGIGIFIVWYHYSIHQNGVFKDCVAFASGCILGVIFGVCILICNSSVSEIKQSLLSLFGLASSDTSSHGINNMIYYFFKMMERGAYLIYKRYFLLLVISVILLLIVSKLFKNYKKLYLSVTVIIWAAFAISNGIWHFAYEKIDSYTWFYIWGDIVYFLSFSYGILFFKKNPYLSVISLILLYVNIAFCFGSDNGIVHTTLLTFITIPVLAMDTLFFIKEYVDCNSTFLKKISCFVLTFFFVIASSEMFVLFLKVDAKGKYGIDYYPDNVYSVDVPEYYGVKTTKETSELLEEVSAFFANNDFDDKHVLVIGAVPGLYSCFDNSFCVDNCWADLLSEDVLVSRLKNETETYGYPIIIISRYRNWGVENITNTVLNFVENNNYVLTYSSADTDFYLPLEK